MHSVYLFEKTWIKEH